MAAIEEVTRESTLTSLAFRDVAATLRRFQHGRGDVTTRVESTGRGSDSSGRFVRSTWTPDGPGTVAIAWSESMGIDAQAWGPGRTWLLDRVPRLIGDLDAGAPHLERDAHPVVAAATRKYRSVRIGASSGLYHELIPTILQQRITVGEATEQWVRICRALGEPGPGPFPGLLLPPDPRVLARQPTWWFHPLGVERSRASCLVEVARHASKFWDWADLAPSDAAGKLRLLSGIGVWSVGCVLDAALGDPDAVPVGDYHVKNVIGWNLAREPRASDDRMLALLEPYVGQRGRVVRAIRMHGDGAPKFGPKQRVLPMHRW